MRRVKDAWFVVRPGEAVAPERAVDLVRAAELDPCEPYEGFGHDAQKSEAVKRHLREAADKMAGAKLACDHCDYEVLFLSPRTVLTTHPAHRRVACARCGWSGTASA